MLKYAKIVENETKECSVGLGTNAAFYESIGMAKQEVEQSWDGKWYIVGFAPDKPEREIIQEQIDELESQQTPRTMREYAIDSRAGKTAETSYAIEKVEKIDAQIAELRKLL